jgi:hypothetical protein
MVGTKQIAREIDIGYTCQGGGSESRIEFGTGSYQRQVGVGCVSHSKHAHEYARTFGGTQGRSKNDIISM